MENAGAQKPPASRFHLTAGLQNVMCLVVESVSIGRGVSTMLDVRWNTARGESWPPSCRYQGQDIRLNEN